MPPEAWDYDAFVRFYNEISVERGGWRFDGNLSPERLRFYYGSPPLWESLRDFALGRYQMDQEV